MTSGTRRAIVADIHEVPNVNLRDIPGVLQRNVDHMRERAAEGNVAVSCVLIYEDAEGLHTVYTGEGESGPRAALLMQVAHAQFMRSILAAYDEATFDVQG